MHYLCFTDALRYGELTKLGRLPSKLIAKPLNGAALRSRTTHLTCGERYFTAALPLLYLFFTCQAAEWRSAPLSHHTPHLRRAVPFFVALPHHEPHLRRAYLTAALLLLLLLLYFCLTYAVGAHTLPAARGSSVLDCFTLLLYCCFSAALLTISVRVVGM
jgi:hypothetical protein